MSNWLDHSSVIGRIGKVGQKITDPLSWITGGKWAHLTSDVLPRDTNAGLSTVMKPFEKVDKTINPVRKIPIVNRAGDIIASKPGDAIGLVAGAYFGGGALGAGGAGGSAGGAGAGGAGAGAGGTDVAGLEALDSAAVTSEGAEPALMGAGGTAPADGGGLAFNSAKDSQLANEQLDLHAVSDDDTLKGLSAKGGQQQYRMPQQQQRRRQAVAVQPVTVPGADQYAGLVSQLDQQIAQSSKSVKTRGATQAAMQRGLDCAHPVDTNGVHIAAIQELNKQIEELGAQIAAAKKKRAAKGAPV